MHHLIKLFFLETQKEVQELFQNTFSSCDFFAYVESQEDADIVIKVEKSICHFYAFDHYETLDLPAHITFFIQKIKYLYYIRDQILNVPPLILNKNILTFKEHHITLSPMERLMIQTILEKNQIVIEKKILFDILGSGAEDIIYRFRKKITSFPIDFTLEQGQYFLKTHS